MKTVSIIVFFLFVTLNLQAQHDSTFHTIASKLYEFQNNIPYEKIYVHQDRMQYVAGETIWFKVYQSSSEMHPVNSGIVYVELIDGLNRPVAKTKWKLAEGTAAGHIDLPDSLTNGFYQLRAYTQWMQNFGSSAFFTRELQISAKYIDRYALTTDFVLNGKTITASLHFDHLADVTLKYCLRIGNGTTRSFPFVVDAEGDANMDIVLTNKSFNADSLYFVLETPVGNHEYPIHPTPPSSISFFPEGGDLVAGIPTKVAFKITDPNGKAQDGKGVVKDEDGNIIRKFHSIHQGMGYFYFQPEIGKSYSVQLSDLNITAELPPSVPEGVGLEAKRWGNMLRVTLRQNLQKPELLYLTVQKEGTVWLNTCADTNESMTVFDIPVEKLPNGIFTITVYNAGYHAYCERLAFVKYPEPLHLTVRTDRKVYGKRQKVTLSIQAKDIQDKLPRSGSFSLAVVKAGLDNLYERNNFYTDYFLKSELKGHIENPASYFERKDTAALAKLDLLLLTHGWRRYSWKEQIVDEYPEIRYPIEQSLTFSGQIHPWYKGQSSDKMILNAMFRHDSIKEVLQAKPGPGGTFLFTGYDFCDTAEVILSAQDKMERMLDLSIMDHAPVSSAYYSYKKRMERSHDSVYAELRGNISLNPAKGIDKVVHEIPEVKVTARSPKKKSVFQLHDDVFSKRIFEVKRDFTYTAYGDFGEGSLGALGILRYMSVKYRNITAKEIGTDEPVFVLDGMRIPKRFLTGISPAFIERVEVLSDAAAMIYGGKHGGFYFHTRTNMSYDLPTKTVVYKFAGYNQQKEFYAPDYAKGKNDYIVPDHRNTLYWQPYVLLNKDGKAEYEFYTSDDADDLDIICEGRYTERKIGVVQGQVKIK